MYSHGEKSVIFCIRDLLTRNITDFSPLYSDASLLKVNEFELQLESVKKGQVKIPIN